MIDRTYAIGRLVTVHVSGCAGPAARWIERVLGPLETAPASAPEVRIVLAGEAEPTSARLAPLPVSPGDGGLWVADHLGRAAFLPFEGGPAIVDASIDPWFFQLWVYMPLVRAALWRRGAGILHAAAVEFGGRRIAISAWQGTGKSSIMLRCLRAGANLLADDWLAIAPDGTVAPITGQLNLVEDQHRALIASPWPGRRSRARKVAARAARWGSRRAARFHKVSVGLARAADWGRAAGKAKVGLAEVYPDLRVADAGRLDLVVGLVRPGCSPPSLADVPEFLATSSEVEWRHCADLEAAYRHARPGALRGPIFPAAPEERTLFARALGGARVIALPFGGGDAEADGLVDRLLRPADRERVG